MALSNNTQKMLFIIGAILLTGGAITYFYSKDLAIYPFVIGAIITSYIKYVNQPKPDDFRIKRLAKMQAFSVILLLFSCFLMGIKNDSWILALIISAIIDLVISFRTPKKDEK